MNRMGWKTIAQYHKRSHTDLRMYLRFVFLLDVRCFDKKKKKKAHYLNTSCCTTGTPYMDSSIYILLWCATFPETGEPCTKMNSDINICILNILVAHKRWCIFHCDVSVMFSLCLLHHIVLLVFIALSQPIQTITIVRYPNRAKIHECVIVNHARQGPSPPSILSPLISLNPGTAAPGFSSLWTKGDGWTWRGRGGMDLETPVVYSYIYWKWHGEK